MGPVQRSKPFLYQPQKTSIPTPQESSGERDAAPWGWAIVVATECGGSTSAQGTRATMRAMFSRSLSRSPMATVLATGVALAFAFGAALVTSVVSAAPASAHAALVKITPDANAQLATAPTEVVLEFDEPVSATFATVLVTTAAGVSVARGTPAVLGAKVTQALSPDLVSGGYRIAFRVLSDDGHPVSGESSFTLTLTPGTSPGTSGGTSSASPVPPTPSAAAAGSTAKSPKRGQGGWLSSLLIPIAGALGLLVIGTGVLLWHRQRR